MSSARSCTLERVIVAFVVLAIVLAGCANGQTPSPVALIVNPDIKDVVTGQTVAITVDARGPNLRFKWSAMRGKLSAFNTPAVIYTAPNVAGADTVTVEVTSALGTTVRSTSFNVSVPPTPTPALAATSAAPAFTIATPFDKVVCPTDKACAFPVAGTVAGATNDPNLKVIVFVNNEPGRSDKWWSHQQVSIIRDGIWQAQAQIGDKVCTPINDDFQIVAMLMTADRAGKITTEWQPLPQGYIAKSNIVNLVTAYDPVPVDLCCVTTLNDNGATFTLSAPGTSLGIDYDLGTGGYILITVPLNRNLSCMKELKGSVSFSLEGSGAANSFEVKLDDVDGTNYWIVAPRGSVTANKTVKLQFSDFVVPFANGNAPGMNWQQMKSIQFAISKKPGDEGGKGKIMIKDVMFTP